MKMKTAVLTGPALTYAIAKCEDIECEAGDFAAGEYGPGLKPESHWSQGGTIIKRERIELIRCNDLYFPKGNEKGDYYEPYIMARIGSIKAYGPTEFIAAMRCYVESKIGDEVEIPEELK